MRNKLYIIFTALMALVILSVQALAGGGNRKGTSGADELLLPVGVRGMSMSGSNLSGVSGVDAIYWNPAGLSNTTTSAEVMFSHTNWFGGVGVDYVAIGTAFTGFGNLGFTVKSISFGDIIQTTEQTPDGTGATYTPTFVTVGLTYSRALTDRIRAGVTANLVTERLSRSSASGLAIDIGLQYQGLAGMRGLQLGVALRHLGPNMKYDGSDMYRVSQESNARRDAQLLKLETAGFQLPTTLEIGMGYTAKVSDLHSVTLSGSFQNNNFLDDQYRIGAEYSFRDWLYLRGGYNLAPEADTDKENKTTFVYGASIGAGVRYDAGDIKLGVDYGYNTTKIFNGIHAFSLYVGF